LVALIENISSFNLPFTEKQGFGRTQACNEVAFNFILMASVSPALLRISTENPNLKSNKGNAFFISTRAQ